MSTSVVYSLFKSVKQLGGVGDKRFEAYKRLNIYTLRDLIYHFPVDKIDRRVEPPLSCVKEAQIISQVVQVNQILLPPQFNRKAPARIICSNNSGSINLLYFNARKDFLNVNFAIGKKMAISGKVVRNYDQLDMVHPDIVTDAANLHMVKRLDPIYPLTYTLTSRYLGATIAKAISVTPTLPEWLDPQMVQTNQWPSWKEALETTHFLKQDKMDVYSKAKARLAYDEILAQQVCQQIARAKIKVPRKAPLEFSDTLVKQYLSALPFDLTNGQREVIDEITCDQKSGQRMFRLLQGDVGSGKTVVAFCAMLNCIAAGKQAALMVPTEILALQHYKKLQSVAEALGIKVILLINAIKTSEKNKAKEQLVSGEAQLVIGTHALFQDRVAFHCLGLVVVDEQHRFGVEQRLLLVDKGKDADYLMMTATPIPRTLSMVSYGDIDISTIKEKPGCRQEIITSIMKEGRISDVVAGLQRMLEHGDKVYWVCPLVEDSEKLALANATARFDFLNQYFPSLVGLVHGQMASVERNENMEKFISGTHKILVATTVIEVGVDVPDATVIIIENAERFGLSQLHQLRGRVGRGGKKSYCILLAGKATSYEGYQRLTALKNTNDGFELAEKDLELRGGGDLLGTKQSGIPDFRAINLLEHSGLIPVAREEARKLFENDPNFTSERAQKLKTLLHLFEMDKSLSYIETQR